eukprot:6169193-Alexandrium_andersonii.AAC.1
MSGASTAAGCKLPPPPCVGTQGAQASSPPAIGWVSGFRDTSGAVRSVFNCSVLGGPPSPPAAWGTSG